MAEIIRLTKAPERGLFLGASCAFGVFDGVHKGHRYLIDSARKTATDSQGKSVALTFDIDPDEMFRPERLKKLMTNEERFNMLAQTGVDEVVVFPFTPAFSAQSPYAFLERTFNGTPPAFLHVGHDFRFGARASGTVDELNLWGEEKGVGVCVHDLKDSGDVPISATRIRKLLEKGDICEANQLLGRPYFLTGTVERGRGEGANLGFRTANFVVEDQLRPLADGVYAACVKVAGESYKAAVNVGIAATFADRSYATCEAHILDFEGDLYGMPVKVEFLHWLRPVRKFDNIDELIATVQGNIEWVRDNV